MEILEALAALDVANNEQWTTDGLPKVEAVAALVGNDKLKRTDIIEAAPDFNRDAAKAAIEPDSSDEVAPLEPPVEGAKPVGSNDEVANPETEAKPSNEDNDVKTSLEIVPAAPKADANDAEKTEVKEKPKFDTLLEEVEYAFVEAQNELNEIGREESRLREIRIELERKCGYLGGQVDRLKKSTGASETAIQQYLANNRKIAQEKAEARKALLESGIADVLKSVGPAAIDAALRQRKPLPSNIRRQYPKAITADKT